jgi:hypothetical protein
MSGKLAPVKGEFRLELACIVIKPVAGPPMRALVLAVAEMEPPQREWVTCGLALENGTNVVKPVRREDFLNGQKAPVTLVEAPDMQGAPLLYTPTGGKAA